MYMNVDYLKEIMAQIDMDETVFNKFSINRVNVQKNKTCHKLPIIKEIISKQIKSLTCEWDNRKAFKT